MHIMQITMTLLLTLLFICGSTQAAKRRASICLQPAQSGRCFGYVPSYAYDPYARKCEQFIYGGCGGNENRFETKAECERTCRDV